MKSELVVSSIRDAVSAGVVVAGVDAELAQAYSLLCTEANRRLGACRDYLKQGMIGEALRVADAEPQLLDHCGALDFVGVENWVALCQQKGWPVSERLDARAIQEINEAFSSGKILEPLLKDYRRAVRTGGTQECVRLLRRLVEVDRANANWAEDLKGFERKRWVELQAEYERADKSEDEKALGRLLQEIEGTWSLPFDEKLRARVRQRLRSVYEKKALVRGDEIARSVSKAYAGLNFDALASDLDAYDSLLAEGYLSPGQAMRTQVDEAREWFLAEKTKRNDELVYQETLGRLRTAVECGRASELAETLNALSRYNQPIPDRLEERAQSLLQAHEVALARKRKLVVGAVIALALLLLAGTAKYVAVQKHSQAVAAAVEELDARLQGEDLSAYQSILDRLQREAPSTYRDAEIQKRVVYLRDLESLIEKKRAAFSGVMHRLDAIQAAKFVEPAEMVEQLLAEARANVIRGEPQGRLAAFLREWEARKLAVQAQIDERAEQDVVALTATLDRLDAASNRPDSARLDQFEELNTVIAAMQKRHEQASEAVRIHLNSLANRAAEVERAVRGRQEQTAAMQLSKRLSDYLEAAGTYARAFPADPGSAAIGTVLASAGLYLDVMEPPIVCGPSNVIWASDMRLIQERAEKVTSEWPKVKDQFLALEGEPRFTDMWEAEVQQGTLFFEGNPRGLFAGGGKMFRGLAYIPKPSDLQPEFSEMTVNDFVLIRYWMMPHCDFVKGLVSLARFGKAESGDKALIGKIEDLYATNRISPLLKLRLSEMLAGQLESLGLGQTIPEWLDFRADLQSIPPGLHWLCTNHRDVILANKEAGLILKRWIEERGILKRAMRQDSIRKIAKTRNICWAGFADAVDPGKVTWVAGVRPQEVWVVRLEAGKPKIMLAEETYDGKPHRYISYLPAEPLFAPGDGKTTRAHLSDLTKKFGAVSAASDTWPVAWPENLRN